MMFMLGFNRCEWKNKKENIKSEGTTLEGKWKVICKVQMKSHFSHIGKRKGKSCPYRRKHFHYFLKSEEEDAPRTVVVGARSARLRLRLRIQIWKMMWLIDKFFGQNLFNQFLLNQINLVKIISYKFAGNSNGNIPKSCYSFRKVVTFQKVVIFLIDTFFRKDVIFPKDTTFWIKWVWTDFTEQTCSLLKMAIKGSQFLIF